MQPSNDRHDRRETVNDRQETVRRVTVPEAAQILQTTPDAVRSRLRRGKLRKDVADDGTVLVVLDAAFVEGHGGQTDGHDGQTDGHDGQTDRQASEAGALVDSLQEQVEFLRQQLQQEREANRENRRLLAAALERIPAIEAPPDTPPPEARGSSETASEEPSGTQASQGHPEEERRSWWRRLIEG